MAQTLYGAFVGKIPTNEQNLSYDVIGKNSEVFTYGDVVTVDAAHGAKVAGATDTVYGAYAGSTQTMSATNETVAFVKPAIVPIDQDMEFLMGTNADLSVLTGPSTYFKLTGTTGVQQVDVTSGAQTTTSRVVMCTKVDPNGIGGTGSGSGLRQGLFKFVKVFNVKSNT
jgi:hypothetical protein